MSLFLLSIALLIVLILVGVPVAYSMGFTAIVYIMAIDPSFLRQDNVFECVVALYSER